MKRLGGAQKTEHVLAANHRHDDKRAFFGSNEPLRGLTNVLLAFVLACGLVPVATVFDNHAYADNAADSTAGSVQKNDKEMIIVYEDEALGLDESLNSSARSAETTLQDIGVVDQEEVAPTTEGHGSVALAQLSDDVSMDEAIQQVEAAPGIAYAQPNYAYSLLATTSDPYCVSDAAGTTTDDQQYLFDSKIVDAWDYAKAEGSVTVAVVDTGCNLAHVDLQGTVDAEHAYDAASGMPLSQSGVANNGDAIGHGTLVSGVIAAQADNGQGIAGASYNANVLPIKVFDDQNVCTSADIIAAYAYLDELVKTGAVSNLRVINMSLGYYSDGGDQADQALRDSIANMLSEHDVLTICAGGNGDASGSASTAACYPSDFDECLSVTALDEAGANAAFSDYNAAKDISAPGVNILSTGVDGGYASATGSSMSAPLVSGAAALLWTADPGLAASEVVDVLQRTAADVTGNAHSGSGSAGALDACAAVAEVLGAAVEGDGALDEDDPELADDANENAVIGSGGDPADAPEAGASGGANEEDSASGTMEEKENSWRYKDGELQTGVVGSGSSSSNILPYGADSTWTKSGSTWSTMHGGSRMTVTDAKAFGIDVSEHNSNINWTRAKAAGVEFAIIRCGYGMNQSNQDDDWFFQNVRGCLDNGIPFGIYLYSYADGTSRASSEADHVLRLLREAGLNPSSLAYPVYYDLEEKSLENTANRGLLANIAKTFCNKISNAGYTPGVYANANWFTNYLTDPCFNNWSKWVASYPYRGSENAKTTYNGTYDMWQCMSTGRVDGINTAVDINFDYVAFMLGGAYMEEDYSTPSTPYSRTVADGEYVINSSLSANMVCDIASASSSPGANLQLYTSNMTTAQRFIFSYDAATGFYTIKNTRSGLVLGLRQVGSSGYSTNVAQYVVDSGDHSQRWIIQANGNAYTLASAANPAYVLDVAAANASNGANVQLYRANGSTAQSFALIATNPAVTGSKTVDDGIYSISMSANRSAVLDVAAGSTSSGANIQIYTSNSTAAQKFRISYDGEGFYTVSSLRSGLPLEAADGNLVNKTNVRQAAPTSSAAQKWAISKNSDGTFTFVCKANGLALDVAAGSTANGANVQTYASNGSAAQRFGLTSAKAPRTVADGVYTIGSALGGSLVLDVAAGSKASGANVQLYASNSTAAQKFRVSYDEETGFYTVTNLNSGKVLDVAAGSTVNGTNVRQYDSNNTLAQRWLIRAAGSSFEIASAVNPACVLDVAAANASNGANVQLYASNGSAAQRFGLTSR